MYIVRRLAFILIISCCGNVGAQSFGYQDAESPLGAVGMMKVTLHGIDYFKTRCDVRFPEIQKEIESNLMIWKTSEAVAIRKTEERWQEMKEQDQRFSQMLTVYEGMLQTLLEGFDKMPAEVGNQIYLSTCRKHFSDLASGIWRKRTPNAYRYLDELE